MSPTWRVVAAALVLSIPAIGQSPRLVLPIGHFEGITSACFSPDERKMVTTSGDGTAKIWDANSGYLLTTLSGHGTSTLDAAFSPDGNNIVTASDDGEARIWDALTGQLSAVLKGHRHSVKKVVFNKPGDKVMTISTDRTIRVWQIRPVKSLFTINNHSGSPATVAFDNELKRMTTAAADHSIRIWNPETGELMLTLKGHSAPVSDVKFSPSGRYIISSSEDNTAKVWMAETGGLLSTLTGHEEPVSIMNFSPDEKKIITASEDKTARVWDVQSGKLQFTLEPYDTPVSAQFSPDGKEILTTSKNEATLWSSKDGQQLASPGLPFLMDDYRLAWVTGSFSPAGSTIILTAENGRVAIWDLVSDVVNTDIEPHDRASTLMFNRDGSKCVTISDDKTCKIRDTRSGKVVVRLKSFTPFATLAVYTPDQQKIVAMYDDRYVRIWNPEKGILSSVLDHGSTVRDVSFSRDGSKVITMSNDSFAIVWDTKTNARLFLLDGHRDRVKHASFSQDGALIVSIARYDNLIRIWDAHTGRLINRFEMAEFTALTPETVTLSLDNKIVLVTSAVNDVHAWEIESGNLLFAVENDFYFLNRWNAIALHPDGKRFALAGSEGIVQVREVETGNLLKELKGHVHQVNSICFTRDGNKLLTASYDGTARLWDVSTGRTLVSFRGHTGNVRSAFFSEDEKKVLTASEDFTARVWDARTGTSICVLKGHTGWIHSASFSPDGRRVVTTSGDHTSKIWDVSKGRLIATFVPVDSTGYFLQVPAGYYQSTANAARLLHYVTPDLDVISFEQLDIRYNRPDKILTALGNSDTALIKSYRNAWEKRISKLRIDTSHFQQGYAVPRVVFPNRSEVDYLQKNETLRIRIKATGDPVMLDRVHIWINESPVFGKHGIYLRDRKVKDFDTTLVLHLSRGENSIVATATNVSGVESYRMPLLVNCTAPAIHKEMMRFVGIGADRFRDGQYNLKYSRKDIRDLARKLKEYYGEDITIDTLFNEDITPDNLRSLKQKLQQATVDDKVIISYSGHGLLSRDFDYYLSTYNTNFNDPQGNSLPYDELEHLLEDIPARKKLMLIDACHSGEVDKEEINSMGVPADSLVKGLKPVTQKKKNHLGLANSFELMQSLFVNVGKRTGATIISAASGTQYAWESTHHKNGVFTYAILEAMERHPTLKVSELRRIVAERVVYLTNGQQVPTTRSETLSVDWEVW